MLYEAGGGGDHPHELIFLKWLIYKTFILWYRGQTDWPILPHDKVWIYYILERNKLDSSVSHQNHSILCLRIQQIYWTVFSGLHNSSFQWVSMDLLAGCQHAVSSIQGQHPGGSLVLLVLLYLLWNINIKQCYPK